MTEKGYNYPYTEKIPPVLLFNCVTISVYHAFMDNSRFFSNFLFDHFGKAANANSRLAMQGSALM